MVTLLPLKKRDAPLHILNIYCSPKLKNVSFATLFSRTLKAVGRDPLVIVGDFNARSTLCGYARGEKRSRKLAKLASTLGLTLHTGPAFSTRVRNFVTRDTCPDLIVTETIRHADWANTEETLGSDHCILNTTVTTTPLARPHAQTHLPNWRKFRKKYTNLAPIHETGYHAWSRRLITHVRSTEILVHLSEATPGVDNHVLYFWEARHSLVRRWRRQKHNRKLTICIAELPRRAAFKDSVGSRLLAQLHIYHLTETEEHVRIPEVRRYALHVHPLPANVTRDDHSGRRLARVEALACHYGYKHCILHV
ncbi:hypothetical protein HPB51_028430 [Rhipicephalus microplus]|uniref:Endonuclease/exonuclease/phosphatase domain-containing protein n=1 Tax=Rhipicephalus microplus TaxID=6941 RepID=A0A9J6CXA7_RHIMP|nr:hypothetical protein HPB51_028430 [Rhipicephalus microplus]